jgi:hypothetical protein
MLKVQTDESAGEAFGLRGENIALRGDTQRRRGKKNKQKEQTDPRANRIEFQAIAC